MSQRPTVEDKHEVCFEFPADGGLMVEVENTFFFCTILSSMEINITICIHCRKSCQNVDVEQMANKIQYAHIQHMELLDGSSVMTAGGCWNNQRLYKTLKNSSWPLVEKPLRRTVYKKKYIHHLNAGLGGSVAEETPLC